MRFNREQRRLRVIERGLEQSDPTLARRIGTGRISWTARNHPFLAAGLDLLGTICLVAGLLVNIHWAGAGCFALMAGACMHCTHHSRAQARTRSVTPAPPSRQAQHRMTIPDVLIAPPRSATRRRARRARSRP
ncbi:DUF3040 domain-containing protein [Saccharothrix sp. AJ9571]|nr:DUF3040 domain-containing protein [Saccharothrix sp. AJ9571]